MHLLLIIFIPNIHLKNFNNDNGKKCCIDKQEEREREKKINKTGNLNINRQLTHLKRVKYTLCQLNT